VTLRGVVHGRPTLRKTRVVGQQQQIVRLDYEEVTAPEAAVETALLAEVTAALPSCDIVVISDYAKGVVSERVAQTIIAAAHAAGLAVVVDPRPQHRQYYQGCDYLTPNWKESRALLGLPEADATAEGAATVARALATAIDANIVLTLGPHGMLFQGREGGEQFALPTLAREVFDVSGAGDTVVAAFALARAAGADHPTAVTLANRAASVVVGKFGTATVTPEELLAATETGRLLSRRALAGLAARLRGQGKRIVTTNGSFDLLHAGHLHLLSEARQRGDVLIVGLNSDASVRRYKGPTRPIVPERQRAALLLALRPVDYVHIFDEPDPIAFLRELAPDVHVNSAEYGSDCIESGTVRQRGGTLHLVERLPGFSTTHLVDALQTPTGSPSERAHAR
jgi:D-beta-D-heptose 7-phosphate kinase/D-beta-D-heptose 1-phosphate adenosyltransferase